MHKSALSRREFIRVGAGTAVMGRGRGTSILNPNVMLQASPRVAAPSDRVRFGSVGTGVRGCTLIRTALSCPGTEIVAACDLYDGRLAAAKEYAHKDLFTTKDYRAILDRQDIDAVFVATPDHWHAQIVQEACAAGKDVYCEKTLSHTVDEGFAVVGAMQAHKRIVQVGSQRASQFSTLKPRRFMIVGRLDKSQRLKPGSIATMQAVPGFTPSRQTRVKRRLTGNGFWGAHRCVPLIPSASFGGDAFAITVRACRGTSMYIC